MRPIYLVFCLLFGAFVSVAFFGLWKFSVIGIAVLLGMLGLARIRADAVQRFTARYRGFLPVVAFGTVMIVVGPHARAQVEFFSTAAQIIPVLLLALVLEGRFLGASSDDDDWVVGLVTVVLLAIGEIVALDAVAKARVTTDGPAIVAAAIGAGFTGIVVSAFGHASAGRLDKARPPNGKPEGSEQDHGRAPMP